MKSVVGGLCVLVFVACNMNDLFTKDKMQNTQKELQRYFCTCTFLSKRCKILCEWQGIFCRKWSDREFLQNCRKNSCTNLSWQYCHDHCKITRDFTCTGWRSQIRNLSITDMTGEKQLSQNGHESDCKERLQLLTPCSLLNIMGSAPSPRDSGPAAAAASRRLGWMPEKLALRLNDVILDNATCWLWKLRLRTTACCPCMNYPNKKKCKLHVSSQHQYQLPHGQETTS